MRTMILILSAVVVLAAGCESVDSVRLDSSADRGAADTAPAAERVAARDTLAAADTDAANPCFASDPAPAATVDVQACASGAGAACTYRETRPNGSTLRVWGCNWAGATCVQSCGADSGAPR